MDHLETDKNPFFEKKIGSFIKFGQLTLKSPLWMIVWPCSHLHLIGIHLVRLLTKFHPHTSSYSRQNAQKPLKKTLKIDRFQVKFSHGRRRAMKKWMTHLWKIIYRRFRISNQIFRSIYGSRDIERSLDTTLPVFGQNWHFVDEYLENGANAVPEIFRDCV